MAPISTSAAYASQPSLASVQANLPSDLTDIQRNAVLAIHQFLLQQPVTSGRRQISRFAIRNSPNLHRIRSTGAVSKTIINSRTGVISKQSGLVTKDHSAKDASSKHVESPFTAEELGFTEEEFIWLCIPGTWNPWLDAEKTGGIPRTPTRRAARSRLPPVDTGSNPRKRKADDDEDIETDYRTPQSSRSTRSKRARRANAETESDSDSDISLPSSNETDEGDEDDDDDEESAPFVDQEDYQTSPSPFAVAGAEDPSTPTNTPLPSPTATPPPQPSPTALQTISTHSSLCGTLSPRAASPDDLFTTISPSMPSPSLGDQTIWPPHLHPRRPSLHPQYPAPETTNPALLSADPDAPASPSLDAGDNATASLADTVALPAGMRLAPELGEGYGGAEGQRACGVQNWEGALTVEERAEDVFGMGVVAGTGEGTVGEDAGQEMDLWYGYGDGEELDQIAREAEAGGLNWVAEQWEKMVEYEG